MRRTLVVALLAGIAAFAFAEPASALPSSTATHIGETDAGVIKVGRNDRNWRKGHYDRRYRGYAYKPYYRYHRPYPYYYRPYAYGGYPYWWYGRPGISFGFSF